MLALQGSLEEQPVALEFLLAAHVTSEILQGEQPRRLAAGGGGFYQAQVTLPRRVGVFQGDFLVEGDAAARFQQDASERVVVLHDGFA